MDWRWLGRLAGVVLLLGAGVVLLVGVQVRGAPRDSGARAASCGSAWDVVAGRSDWQEWWTHDLTDPLDGSGGRPVRTVLCPDAVNDHILASGGLALAAFAMVTAGEVVHRRRTPVRPERRVAGTHGNPAARLVVFATVATVAGVTLTVGGLIGLALLTADPNDALFDYVSRTGVVLAGLLLVLPALVLVALGWAARVVAQRWAADEETSRDTR